MIHICSGNGIINELFFIYKSIPLQEISKPVDFDDFKIVLFQKINLCKDENMLDVKKLNKMYFAYVDFFIKNKGNFKKLFIEGTRQVCYAKPHKIFNSDLWIKTKSNTCKTYYTNRCYKEDYIGDLLRKRQNTVSKEKFKERYGENWKEKFDEYVKKANDARNSNPNIDDIRSKTMKNLGYEYYLDKINEKTGQLYTEEEAKKKVYNIRMKSVKIVSDNRRGKKGVTCRSVEYWIKKGFTEEEAKEKVREIQSTNNIETYIKKYGEQEGIQKWIERNKKWGEQMIEKKMEIGHVGSAQSKSANKLFDKVIEKLKDENILFEKIYYGEKEFCKLDKEYKRVYFYDFVIPEINLCVEYNGIKFHPREGDKNWVCLFSGIGYEEKLQYDKQKIKTIEDYGFKTLIIWEDEDIETCVNKIIDMCKELLRDKNLLYLNKR